MPEILDTVIVELIGDDSKLRQALDRAGRSATTAANRIESAFARAVGPSTRLLGSVTVLGGALSALGIRAVSMAGDMEQARIGLTTMLGSADAADRHLRKLYDFAAKTPFEISGLIDADRRLMAMGFSAEEVIPTLTAIGDAVAAVGGNSQLLDRVTLALGQMRAKGKVSGEEMRQLAEAGIPAWEMLANAIGTDIPTAMKQAEQGGIDAATGIAAILSGMEQRFAGSMEAQSRTILGMWSNIKDNVTRSMIALGEEITRALDIRDVLQSALDALGRFRGWLESGGLIRWWDNYHGAIVIVAGAIGGALTPAIVALTGALWGALSPLTPFIAAGGALAAVFVRMGGTMADVKVALKTLGTLFAGLWDITSGFVAGTVAKIAALGDAWRHLVSGMSRSLALLGDALNATLAGDLGRAADLSRTAALAAKTAWTSAGRDIGKAGDAAADRIYRGMTEVADVITGRVGASWQAAQHDAKQLEASAERSATAITRLYGSSAPAAIGRTTAALHRATQQAHDLGRALASSVGMYGGSGTNIGRIAVNPIAPAGHSDIAGGRGVITHWDFDTAARAAGAAIAEAARAALERMAAVYQHGQQWMRWGGINRIGLTPPPDERMGVTPPYQHQPGMYGGTGAGLERRSVGPGTPGHGDIAGGGPLYTSWSSDIADRERAAREESIRSLWDFDTAARDSAAKTERANAILSTMTGAIGNVLGALNPFGAILRAINPIGTVIQSMLKQLGPVLEPIVKVFADIGAVLGRILAPALKLIAPLVKWLGQVLGAVARFVAGIWNAIARGLNAVLGWLGVNIPTIDLSGNISGGGGGDTGSGAPEPTWSGWGDATQPTATVGIAAVPATVTATPGWVHRMGTHVDRFGAYVTRLVEEGIHVQIDGVGRGGATAAGGVWDRAVAGELG